MRGSEPMPWRTCSMSAPSVVGEVGELVHERDARGEHRVGGVLGELGRAHVHHQQALVVALERRVDGAHRGDRALVVGADHDAVGPHEVLDRRAFLQELRIRDDGERQCRRRARRAPRRSPRAPCRRCPTGTVDLSTTILYSVIRRPMSRAAASTYCMSAEPSSSGGVPTAMNCSAPCATAASTSVVKRRRPAATLRADHRLEPRLVDRHAAARSASRSCARRRRGTARRCRLRRGRRR